MMNIFDVEGLEEKPIEYLYFCRKCESYSYVMFGDELSCYNCRNIKLQIMEGNWRKEWSILAWIWQKNQDRINKIVDDIASGNIVGIKESRVRLKS